MPSNPNDLLHVIFRTSHRLLLDRIIRREFPRIGGEVLVIGAGHDPYSRYLSDGSVVCKTDLFAGENIDLVADAHELPFDAETFNHVLAIEVFEHLQRPSVAASEVLRVLKPGGQVHISVPFMFHIHTDPMDFNRFTKSGLETLFEEFKETEVLGYGNRAHVISDLLTTAFGLAKGFRIFNHLLVGILQQTSHDSPSGYWVTSTK